MTLDPRVLDELERLERVMNSCVHRNCEGGDCVACYHCKQFDDYLSENAPALLAAARDGERLREAAEFVAQALPDAYVDKLIFSKRTAIRQLKAALAQGA